MHRALCQNYKKNLRQTIKCICSSVNLTSNNNSTVLIYYRFCFNVLNHFHPLYPNILNNPVVRPMFWHIYVIFFPIDRRRSEQKSIYSFTKLILKIGKMPNQILKLGIGI